MRINVTGNAGSGKSTISQQLASELRLPLIEMDRIIWQPGWQRTPTDQAHEQLDKLLQSESWVLDGVSRLGRRHADLIVFLDFPRRLCAWRCAQRNWRYLFSSRPGLPDGCPEWKIVPTLARIIMDFPNKARPVIIEDIAASQSHAVVIQNAADLARFIQTIPLLQNRSSPLIHRLP